MNFYFKLHNKDKTLKEIFFEFVMFLRFFKDLKPSF